jgi:hypothetical protein
LTGGQGVLTIIVQGIDDQIDATLNLEHSLSSVSKWESEVQRPFFGKEQMTQDETSIYIKHMVLGEPPPGDWLKRLQPTQFVEITDYINNKQTATWFREDPNQPASREIVTTELVYYWMTQFNIPFEPCENWHLNRLMTLIKICGIKQTKQKPMNKKQQLEEYRRLNAQRRQQLGTSG